LYIIIFYVVHYITNTSITRSTRDDLANAVAKIGVNNLRKIIHKHEKSLPTRSLELGKLSLSQREKTAQDRNPGFTSQANR
jgi:hypothetical protein